MIPSTHLQNVTQGLVDLGLTDCHGLYWDLSPAELIAEAVINQEGVLTDNGALMFDTGRFTGRSPKDRFIVEDDITRDLIWWGDVNIPFSPDQFDRLYDRLMANLSRKKVYVRDAYAGADPQYRIKVRIVDTLAAHNLFCHNMFIRPEAEDLSAFEPDWHVITDPEFYADPERDGTRQQNFTLINFTRRIILIGGTGYTGESKKGIFGVLNCLLPQKGVLPMHCSANQGEDGDTAVFFGLSGTGKTTLSADPNRHLIGDDEHGWSEQGIFNFEGGCYAKVIDLTEEKEPEIYRAIKFGALLENTRFFPGSTEVNYGDRRVSENTRVSYPLSYIPNALIPSVGALPRNIFFLTADAYGVLPPIAKLTKAQAMYHFISGYTAKVAGTEMGVKEPQAAFSACFGAPFMPLHPARYAELLGQKMVEHEVDIWLINTGWTGGPFGVGSRMKLPLTRAMITAALKGQLSDVAYEAHPVFGVLVPQEVPGVPAEVLNPRDTWADPQAYDAQADKLAHAFVKNFQPFETYANEEIMAGAPRVQITQ
jgi:phosphoenolpyruvate carboxykinase (ATP)